MLPKKIDTARIYARRNLAYVAAITGGRLPVDDAPQHDATLPTAAKQLGRKVINTEGIYRRRNANVRHLAEDGRALR